MAAVATACILLTACGAGGSSHTATTTSAPAAAQSLSPNSAPAATAPTTATPIASGAPGPAADCGVNLSSPVVRSAIATLPIEPLTHVAWDTDPATFEGNFDPCATLSTAIITIQGATGSSPNQALMFNRGRYLGTATTKAYGFTELDRPATTDDTVGLTYKTPGSCNACSDGTYTHVRFHWDGTHVVMQGQPPS